MKIGCWGLTLLMTKCTTRKARGTARILVESGQPITCIIDVAFPYVFFFFFFIG